MTDLLTSNFSDIANISSKDVVSNTKQSSSLVPTRTTFNSNGNRNSNRNSQNNCNSTNQNVKVRDDNIKEIDQSNTKADITTGQGIVGKQTTNDVSLFNYDLKQDNSASVSTSVKRINNNNNGDDDVSHTKQSSDLVHTRHNFNHNSNRNSNSNSNSNSTKNMLP